MLFSGNTFIFLFLPAFFAGYYLLKGKARLIWLLFFSLLFYAWGDPLYLLLMVFSILVNWALALVMDRYPAKKKGILTVSVCFDLLLITVFKYLGFLVSGIKGLGLFPGLPDVSLRLPLGISFYTFQIISYMVDCARDKTRVQHDLLIFASYVTMFPQLIAGPIVRYTDVEEDIAALCEKTCRIPAENVSDGIDRFVRGLGKKVLLANTLGEAWNAIAGSPATAGTLGLWFGAACYTLQIYFDFSGYSDMAIGLGKLMGFRFPENFDHPFMAGNVTEFWRRWHMTLSGFFRDYVYIPLGGNRCSKARNALNMVIVWGLTGLWHGANWNFVLWGLYFCVFLMLEKFIFPHIRLRCPGFLRRILLYAVLIVSFAVFYYTDLSQLGVCLRAMFTCSGVWIGKETWAAMTSYAVWFLLACLAATDFPRRLWAKLEKRFPVPARLAADAAVVLLFLLCIAALTRQTYNPFIYFRF